MYLNRLGDFAGKIGQKAQVKTSLSKVIARVKVLSKPKKRIRSRMAHGDTVPMISPAPKQIRNKSRPPMRPEKNWGRC